MDSALIRGNNFWMSPLLPKINPNATPSADFGFSPASWMRLPYQSKDPLRPELRSVEARVGNGEYGRRHADGVFRR